MLFIALVLSSTSGENYWKKYSYGHTCSPLKWHAKSLLRPLCFKYVSPLQLLAKRSGVGVKTFLNAVVISQVVLIRSGHGLNWRPFLEDVLEVFSDLKTSLTIYSLDYPPSIFWPWCSFPCNVVYKKVFTVLYDCACEIMKKQCWLDFIINCLC